MASIAYIRRALLMSRKSVPFFLRVEQLAETDRYLNGATIDQYAVYRVDGLTGDPFY